MVIYFLALCALLFSIGSLAWAIFATVDHESPHHAKGSHPRQAIVLYTLAALAFFEFVLFSLPAAQLRYRAGDGLIFGCAGEPSSFAPTNLGEARNAAQKLRVAGEHGAVVGGAWSNVLQYRSTRGPRLHLRRLVGRAPERYGHQAWLAGTELMDVNRELAKAGLQLLNVPSYGCVTVGAWVATQGHGMAGAKTEQARIQVRAWVLDLLTGIETDDGPEALLEKFGSGPVKAAQFMVLVVVLDESKALGREQALLRQTKMLRVPEDVTWFLRKDTVARVVFVGNSKALAITWDDAKGRERRRGGGVFKLQVLGFATTGWGGLLGSADNRDHTEKTSAVALFFHVFLNPLYIWFYLASGVVNFEAYTTDVPITPEALLTLTTHLQDVHRRHGGRSELRVQGKFLYVDGFAWNRRGIRATFAALADLGAKRVALHPGKYNLEREDVTCGGLALVTPYEIK